VGAEVSRQVAALLHDQRRQPERADVLAVALEVGGAERPGPGRVALAGVEAEADDQEARPECAYFGEGAGEVIAVGGAGEGLGEREVMVVALARAGAALVLEAEARSIAERPP
jgi:hypothetical protein